MCPSRILWQIQKIPTLFRHTLTAKEVGVPD